MENATTQSPQDNLYSSSPATKKLAVIRTIESSHLNTKELEDELLFWKKEVFVFLQLMKSLEGKRLSPVEKQLLTVFEKELLLLSDYVFKIHEQEISKSTDVTNNDSKAAIIRVHARLRQVYRKMKQNALPLLPKMVPIAIW